MQCITDNYMGSNIKFIPKLGVATIIMVLYYIQQFASYQHALLHTSDAQINQ